MKPISEIIDDFLASALHPSEEKENSGAPWLGDPWCFDVRCLNCDHVYPSSHPFCLICESEDAEPWGFAGPTRTEAQPIE